MKLFKKAKKGFTLVELVVVIAVIAILAAVSVGAYFGVTESAKNSQAQQEGKAVHTNIVLIANDPVNSDRVHFTKDGLVWQAEPIAEGALSHILWIEDKLEEAIGVQDEDLAVVTTTPTSYPAVVILTTGTVNLFEYHLESGRKVTYEISTGELQK